MTKKPSPKPKTTGPQTEVLGRSRATGRNVLKPAGSSAKAVTLEEAYRAVSAVLKKE